jgi:hypothetical protein
MNRTPSKIKLSAYEVMLLMGAGGDDPKLSTHLKAAVDRELAKAEYNGMEEAVAWAKACRYLAINDPAAFDPTNRDDLALQKLFPFMFTEKGRRTPDDKLWGNFDMSNVTVTHEIKGSDVVLNVIAQEEDGTCKSASFRAPLKPGSEGLPSVGIHKCK